jgi:hypothetical protein
LNGQGRDGVAGPRRPIAAQHRLRVVSGFRRWAASQPRPRIPPDKRLCGRSRGLTSESSRTATRPPVRIGMHTHVTTLVTPHRPPLRLVLSFGLFPRKFHAASRVQRCQVVLHDLP